MKTYCFTLDLQSDTEHIAEYRRMHEPGNIWPEVVDCIKHNGVLGEGVYLDGNRLFMILHTTGDFSLETKIEAEQGQPNDAEPGSLDVAAPAADSSGEAR